MQNKIANNPKFQVRLPEEYIDIDDVDDMDEYAEMIPPSKTPKISSSGGTSSTARNVTKGPMNLYFPHKSTQKGGFEKGGGIDETKKILRERAVSAFAIWMYDAGLPFNCVNHKSFDKFIETVGQHGPGMKPPTFHEVRVTHLKKEVEKVEKIVDEHKVQWTKFGCSIMMDKWTARNGKMIINILVNSPIGSVFLGSVDASNESTDSTKMYKLFESTIERIGPENVVQIVTDNASENVKAGSMMMGAYPHIYWTPCAALCINLMFGDIFKVKPYASVFKKAIRIHSYISQRPLLLNLMRKFTKERNLVKPAKTRFATAFLTLRAMYIQRKNLRTLVLSTEWTSSKFAKETLGKDVANLIISAHFWDDVVRALTVCGPLTKVLRLVDGEKKPPMGYIYEAMDRAKETIERGFRGIKKQYEKVFEIIDARWSDQLHRPLHAAGHVLNPGLYYKAQEEGTLLQSLWTEYYACVEKMIPDTTIQDLLVAELPRYKMANGLFGCGPAKRARDTRSPVEWWSLFGSETPNLQKFAMKVLSLTCSSSGCERNWSVFEHMKAWAKAQNINSAKDQTLNSLSIILLVAFHLQTRNPPILPPFSALFRDGNDSVAVESSVCKFSNYGISNKESVAELFVSLLNKLLSVEKLWSEGLCASTFEGSWISQTRGFGVGRINVEDFTDRSQNVARAVGEAEVKKIYSCIQLSVQHIFDFLNRKIGGNSLREFLFGQDVASKLAGTGTAKSIAKGIQARASGKKEVQSVALSKGNKKTVHVDSILTKSRTSARSPRGMAQGKRKLLGPTDSSLTKRSRTDDWLGGTFSELSRKQPGQQPMPYYLTNSWEPVAMISREAMYNRPQPVSFEPTYGRMRFAEPSGHPNLIAPAFPHMFPSRPLIGSQISYEPLRHPVGYPNSVYDSRHSSAYFMPPHPRRF